MAGAPSRTVPRPDTVGAEGTRERILDVALRLFAERSFAGTSLQMIADEMGLTKAAVYHHFHTREQLLITLAQPALDEMRAAVEAAAAERTPQARAERMLTGFVDLAVRHRMLTAVLSVDQAIAKLLTEPLGDLVERPTALLAGSTPGPAGRVRAAVAMAGIATAAGSRLLGDLDDDTMRQYLCETGRHILGLRTPRRPGTVGSARR